MATLNPMQLLQFLKGGDPRTVVEQIISQNYPNDPTMQQLLQLGQQGNVREIENFAKQYFARQGKSFEAELQNLMSTMGLIGK